MANTVGANGNAAYQDKLDLAATASNANVELAGATAAIAAGDSANVVVTAAKAGSLAGSLSLGLTSNANGVTGLSNVALATGTVTVTGASYDYATATLGATALTFGDVRTGAVGTASLTNAILAGGDAAYQDSLDIAATTAVGTLGLAAPTKLLAGQSGDVVVTAATAGSLAGSVALALTSNANGVANLGNLALAGQTIAVTGAAYDLAKPSYVATNALGNLRVGVTTKTLAIGNTTISDAAYQDKLAVVATGAAGLTLVNPADIAAGSSGDVTLGAAVAGSLTGNLSLAFTSKALAGTTLTDVGLAGGAIALTGAAYDYARATVAAELPLGNVRVGALANLGVTNTVTTSAAYQDSLDVTATTAVGTLGLADPANILAGKTGNVVVTAAKAGSLAGDVTLALSSNANGVTGLATTALTGATIAVTGAAYDLASPTFASSLTFGNVRRGATSTLAVANTVGANGNAAYQDKLVVAASAGAVLGVTSPAAIAAGSSANVVVTAAGAGSLAGSLSLGLTSDANGVTGLSDVTLATGTVTVTGASYDLATATLASDTVAFGNVRTGAARTLEVTNTLAAGGLVAYQDSLDVAATTAVGTLALTNPANIRAAQSANLGLTAATAGSLAGSVAVALTSNANGVANLANLALAGRTVAVTGAAYDLAKPAYAATKALGNVRVGAATTVTVANTLITAAGYQDSLDVAAAKTNANLALSGATANVTAGNSATIGITAAAAGSLADTLALTLTSNANGVADLTDVSLAAGAIAVSGAAYDLARADFGATAVTFGNVRTGAVREVAVTNTVASAAAFQDSLDAAASTGVATLSVSSPANLAAGSTGYVGVTAAKAGSLAGAVSVALASNANGVTGLTGANLATQSLTVSGAAYDFAGATLAAATMGLGNIRVGATTNLAVTNTLAANGNAAYQDKLAVAATSSNARLAFVNPADIAADAAGNVGVTAAVAGSLTGTVNLALTSKAPTGTGLADLSLAPQSFTVTGTAFDYANAVVNTAALNFGVLHVGAAAVARTVSVENAVITAANRQDRLTAAGSSALAGLTSTTVTELAAGSSQNLTITVDTATARSLAGNVSVALTSTNTVSGLDAKSLAPATVATTGLVYSGQSVWNTNGNGSWGTFASGFGANWGANQGSAGLDAAFANVDTATFDNTVLTAGESATVSLNGASPSLKGIAFNTTGGGYTIAAGTGGSLTLKSNVGPAAITGTAGTHVVTTAVALDSSVTAAIAAGSIEFSGVLSGEGILSKSGAGTLILSGTNTFTKGVILNAGTLVAKNQSGLGTGTVKVLGGVLDLFGNSVANTIQVFAGQVINSGLGELQASALEIDSSDAVLVSANIAGASSLSKSGTGVLTMTGNNTFSGGVNVLAGTLLVGSTTALGSNVNAVSVKAGSTLDLNGYDATIGSLTNGQSGQGGVVTNTGAAKTLTLNGTADATFGGAVSGALNLVKTGAGSQAFTAASLAYTGTTTIASGTLDFTKTNYATLAGAVSVANGAGLNFAIGGASDYTLAEVLAIRAGTTTLPGLTLGATAAVGVNTANAGAAIVHADVLADGAVTGFAKSGAGTLVLTAANTYTGKTLVTGGILQLGNGGATGSLNLASAIEVVGSGAIAFKRDGNLVQGTHFAAGISGSGAVIQDGLAYDFNNAVNPNNSLNKLTLSGTNTYSGGTILRNGQIKVTNLGSAGTGSLILEAGLFDMNNLALTNPLVLKGGRLTNAANYAGTSGIPAGATFTLDYTLPGNIAVTGDLVIKDGGAITGSTIAIGTTGSTDATLDLTNLSGNFTVTANQTFKGSGTIELDPTKKLIVAGTWAAGNSIGTNSVNGLLELNSNVEIELGTPGTFVSAGKSDRTIVDGSLTLSGASLVLKPTTDMEADGAHGAGAYLIFSGRTTAEDGFTLAGTFASVNATQLGSGPDELHAKVTYETTGTTSGNPITGYNQVAKVTTLNSVANVDETVSASIGADIRYVSGQSGVVDVAATYLANGYALTNGVLVAPTTVNRLITTTETVTTTFVVNGTTYSDVSVNNVDTTKTVTAAGQIVYTDANNTTVDVAATYLANGYTFVNGVLTAPTMVRPLITASGTTSATFTDTVLKVDDLDSPIRGAGLVNDHKVWVELFRLATATAPSPTLALGNIRRGSTLNGSIAIANSASNDGYSEVLKATTTGAAFTGFGNVAGGATGNVAVSFDATAAGANTATGSIVLKSTGIEGYNDTALSTTSITATGYAYDLANPTHAVTLGFGNVRPDATKTLALTNLQRTGGVLAFQDDLAVVTSTGSGLLAATDPTNLLAGQTKDITFRATGPGLLDGRVNLAFSSTGQVDGVDIEGLSSVSTSGSVDVTGAAYAFAVASHDANVAFGNVRPNATRNLSVSNVLLAATATYQDSLRVVATRSNDRLTLANPADIVAGQSANVVVTATAAGFLTDSINLALTSKAAADGLLDGNLSPGTVAVTGAVYDYALASVPTTRDLGNIRVGASANLAIGNTVVSNAAFQDNLAVAATSSAPGVLTVANPGTAIAAGASGNVVLTAAAAGAINGTDVSLVLQSKALAGTGLDDSTLNPATVSITGAAFDLANATHADTAAFAKVRVGQQLALGVTNTLRLAGATAYQDDLAVTATSGSAKVAAAAPANIFAAGSGDVTLTAASAGSLASTLTLGFTSTGKVAGTAITGLTASALAGGTVTVTGEAYDVANATVQPTLALNGVRVGSTANLAVTNAVRTLAAYQDDLGVTATAGTAQLTLANPALIAAGATRNVVVTAAKAGLLTDTLTLSLASKALAASGLADGATTSQTVAVTGTAYDFAVASHDATLALGNVRVTNSATTGTLTVTNALAANGNAAYQDKLDVTATSSNARLSVLGGATAIAATATGDVTVRAVTAGSLAGNLTLGLTSRALAGSGVADSTLANGTVAVTGAAYDVATAAVQSTLALNNIRTGTLTNVSVANTVTTSAAFQDSLDVAATSSNAKLTLTNPANIAAGAARNLVVNAATAGVLDATLTLGLTSNFNNVAGLANVALDAKTIAVTGAAYDLARPTVDATLALGNRRVGSAANLNIANATLTSSTYQDSLDVTSATSNAKLTLANPANIAAGADRNLVVTAATAGVLDATLTLGLTSNANNVAGLVNQALAGKTVAVTGAAYDVANATVQPTLALNGVRVGSTANLAVTNAVRTLAAYQDDLGVTATAGTAQLTLANPALIAAGATRNVVVTAAKAGLLTDTLTLSLASKALAASGLADGATTSQTVAVTGTAYDYAVGNVASSFDLGNVRVGATKTLSVGNVAAGDATYQDNLAVTVTAVGNAALGAVADASIAAGQTGLITYSVNAAGDLAGTTTLAFTSTALAGTGLTDVGLSGGSVALTGTAYGYASADFANNATFALGNVRTGAAVAARNLAFTNTLTAGDAAYQDALTVAASSSNARITATGLTNLAAGATGNVTLAVATTTAGSLDATISTTQTSVAKAGTGLSNLGLGGGTATVTGAAYDLASPTFGTTVAFGNLRVGAAAAVRQLPVTNSVVTAAAYQDSLDVTGAATKSAFTVANPANLAAGATGNVTVTAATTVAGSLADTLALTLVSNANNLDGLANVTLTPGAVSLTGAVYDFANPAVSANTVAFGNVHVGGTLGAQTLEVTNLAKTNATYQDGLAVTASSGNAKVAVAGAGSVAAGNTALTLTLTPSAAAAGSLAGNLSLGFTSLAQSGTGLADAPLTGATVAITGAAYDYAQPAYSNDALAFGNLRVGATPAAKSVTFTNAARTDAAYQEALKVEATGVAGKFSATGFASLAAGSGTASVSVSAVTATAGLLNGNLSLGLTSLATANTGLGDTGLTGGSIAVTGAVYDVAQPTFAAGAVLAFGNVHVGDTLAARNASFTNTVVTSAAYQDALRVLAAAGNAKISAADLSALAAGDTADLAVTASTATAGSLAGNIDLALTSLAKAGTGLADVNLAAGQLTTTGAVYDFAKPTYDAATVAFGNVRTGATVAARGITVNNLAVTDAAFQEALAVAATSANGKLSLTGLAGLEAGTTAGTVEVAAVTTAAGSLAGTVNLGFTSLAKANTGLGDTGLTGGSVSVTGAVYDYASAGVASQTLAFGNVHVGDTLGARTLAVTNTLTAAGYQDNLSVTATAVAGVTASAISELAAGSTANLTFTASSATAGSLAGAVTLGLTSTNTVSGLDAKTLATTATVATTGGVYDYAKPTYDATTVAFGNVRTGATVAARGITVNNLAVTDAAFQEALAVAATSANGKLSLTGLAGLEAGTTAGTVEVAAVTTAAGSLAGTVNLGFTSLAKANTGLSDSPLTAGTVAVTGAVYDYATAGVASKTFDFGRLHVGAAAVADVLSVANILTAAGYQDNLSVTASTVAGVSATTVSELAAGGSADLTFTADTSVARSLTGAVTLGLTSTNTVSGLDTRALTTTATFATTGLVYSGQSVWNTNGNGSWGTFAAGFGANWGANQGSAGLDAAFAGVDTATFDNTALTAGSSATVTLDGAAPSLKAIAFNTAGGGFTLAAGTGGALTFKSDVGDATLTATAGTHTVAAGATLASNLAVSVAADSLAVTGVLSGTGSLAKSGAGLLTLAGANTFAGGATVEAGTLALGHASALGIAAATVNGGTLDLGGFSVTNAVTLTGGVLSNGSLANSALAVSAGTVSANLAGSTTVTKTGTGTATLAVANTYTGATAVQNGTLALGDAAALGTSTVTVAAGATLDLAGLNVTGATLLLNGGSIANSSAYTGSVGFAAGITNFGAADLTSLDANVAVRVAAGQTLDTDTLTRAIDFRGGSLANLGTYAGVLNVKGALDASATGLSTGTINLTATGSIALGATASAKTINYQGGALSGANYTGDLAFTGAVTVAGVVSAGSFSVDAGDTLNIAVNGVSANIKLLGGTVDFGGRTSTASVAFTAGTIANGSGFTGDVSYVGSLNLNQGAFGAGRILVGATNTANFGAGFANRVSYSGGTIQNGANYAGTLTVNAGATLAASTNLAGSIVLDTGAKLSGVGSVGAVTAKNGSEITTGAATPGLLTTAGLRLESGATLMVNMKDATATRGVGFDTVTVNGLLDLSALSAANRVTLQIKSLDANGLTGNLAVQNFAWNDPKNFTLFSYGTLNLANGVSISDVFTIDYSGFKDEHGNVARADWFTISNDTGNGAIVLTAIPEPSTYGLAIGALALAAAALRRRRKNKAADASAQ